MNKTQKTIQEMFQTLRDQIKVFREHLTEVTNVRKMIYAEEVDWLYDDIDALLPTCKGIENAAIKAKNETIEYWANSAQGKLREIELEIVLLKDVCQGKPTRQLLNQQRCLEKEANYTLNALDKILN